MSTAITPTKAEAPSGGIVVRFPEGKAAVRESLAAFAISQGLDLHGYLSRVFAASLERQMRAGVVKRQVINVESILELVE